MTKRIIYSRLDQSLSWLGSSRKSERRAEAEIDLQRQTVEAFADVDEGISQGIVLITLQRATPRPDGKYRPKVAWALALAIYPIWRGLEDAKLLGDPVDLLTRIRDCEYEDECILVELLEV
jgi:hypothetical protein